MAKAQFGEDVRARIVQSLACFDSPSVVVKMVKKDFGHDVSRQHVESYDPTKKAGAKLAPKWKAIFEAARMAFMADTSAIPISHKTVRLRALNRMAEKAEIGGNIVLAAQLLRQAAEEMGGVYTNRREIAGKGASPDWTPWPNQPVTIFQLPDNGRPVSRPALSASDNGHSHYQSGAVN